MRLRQIVWAGLAIAMVPGLLSSCRGDEGPGGLIVHKRIGPSGGILTSYDSVLTLAFLPGALDSPVDFFIEPTDVPPDVYGPAYRVDPNPNLLLPITVTYRFDLPEERVAVVAVDPVEYSSEEARWTLLKRIDVADKLVKALDKKVSLFYALLDDGPLIVDVGGDDDGGTTTGVADDAGPDVGPGEDPVDDGSEEETAATDESDTGPPGPCDPVNAFMGPYVVEPFVTMDGPGAEDLGFSEDLGVFAVVADDIVQFVDPDGVVTAFSDVLNAGTITTGTRFLDDGDILVGSFFNNVILRVSAADGTVTEFSTPPTLDGPNQVFTDIRGNIWVTSYFGSEIIIIDASDGSSRVFLPNTAPLPNGLVVDYERNLVFWDAYNAGELYRASFDDELNLVPNSIALVGTPAFTLDGMTIDSCGSIFVMSEGAGGSSRLMRVFTNDNGEEVFTEEVVGPGGTAQFPTSALSNAQFAQGAGWEAYSTTLFITGLPGSIYTVDVGIEGAPSIANGDAR